MPERLRADPATAHIQEMAESANAMQTYINAAMAAGFSGCLTKPLALETPRAAPGPSARGPAH